MQPLVVGRTIVDVALVVDFQGLDEERHLACLRLRDVALAQLVAYFKKLCRGGVFADEQTSHVRAHSSYEMVRLETFADDVVQHEQDVAGVALEDVVNGTEIIVVVEHVEVVDDVFVGDGLAGEADHLVEDGKGVAQGSVGLLGDDVQGLSFCIDAFARSYESKVLGNVIDGDALEVVDLASRKDGRDDLVLLGGGEDEFGVRWRLFEGLEEGVESVFAQHVNLVDDIHLVVADLRWDAHLVNKAADVVNRVVGSGIEFVDVERGVVVEGAARFAFVAGFKVFGWMQAVDGLGHDAGASGLAHASRTAKQEGLGQSVVADGVFQGRCDGLLTHHGVKSRWSILSCRYDEVFHFSLFKTDKDTFFRDNGEDFLENGGKMLQNVRPDSQNCRKCVSLRSKRKWFWLVLIK